MESLFSLLDNAENAKFFSFGVKPNGKKFSYLFSDIIVNENEKSNEASETGDGKINLIGIPNISNDQGTDEQVKSKSNPQIEILYPNMFGKISEQDKNLNYTLNSETSIPNDKIETGDTKNKIKFEESDKPNEKLETQPIFDFFTLSGFSVPQENELNSFNAFAKGQKANIVGSNEQIKEIIAELSKSPNSTGQVIIENDNLIPEIEKLFGIEFPPEIQEALKDGKQLNLLFKSTSENDKKTLIVQIAPFENSIENENSIQDSAKNHKISQKSLFQKINSEENKGNQQTKFTGGNVLESANKKDVSLFKFQWGKQTFQQFSSLNEKTAEPVLNNVFANTAKEESVNKTNNLFGIEDNVVKENFVSTEKLSQPNSNIKTDGIKLSEPKVSDSGNLEIQISGENSKSDNKVNKTVISEMKGNIVPKSDENRNNLNSASKTVNPLVNKEPKDIARPINNDLSKVLVNDSNENSVDKPKLASEVESESGNKFTTAQKTNNRNFFQNKEAKIEAAIKNSQSANSEQKIDNAEIKNTGKNVDLKNISSSENSTAKEAVVVNKESVNSKTKIFPTEEVILKTESGLKISLDTDLSKQQVKSAPAEIPSDEIENSEVYNSPKLKVNTDSPELIKTETIGTLSESDETGFDLKQTSKPVQNKPELTKNLGFEKEIPKTNVQPQKNESVLSKVIEFAENDKYDQVKIVVKQKVSVPQVSDLHEESTSSKNTFKPNSTGILGSTNSKNLGNVFQSMRDFVSGYEQNLKSFIEDDFKADVEKNSKDLLARLKGLESKNSNDFVKALGNSGSKKIYNLDFNDTKPALAKLENQNVNEVQDQENTVLNTPKSSGTEKLVNTSTDNKNFVKISGNEVFPKLESNKIEYSAISNNNGFVKAEHYTENGVNNSAKVVTPKIESSKSEYSANLNNDGFVKPEHHAENEIKSSSKEVYPKFESSEPERTNRLKNIGSEKPEHHTESEIKNSKNEVHSKIELNRLDNSNNLKSDTSDKIEHQAKSVSNHERATEKNSSNLVNQKISVVHDKTDPQKTEFTHSVETQNLKNGLERLSQTVSKNHVFVNSEIKSETKNFNKPNSESVTTVASKNEVNKQISSEDGSLKSETDADGGNKDSQISSSMKSESNNSKDSTIKNEFINNFNKVNEMDRTNAQPKAHQVFARPVPKEEIIKEIQTQLSSGKNQSIEIKLDPKELGHIKIQMDVIDKVLHAKVEVENEQVQHLLNNNIDLLKQNLVQNGLQLNSFNISLSNPNQNKYAGNSKKREQDNNTTGEAAPGDEEKIKNSEKHYGYNTIEYVA